MAYTSISGADYTNMSGISYDDMEVNDSTARLTIDHAREEELTYIPSWLKWKGYYDTIPELQATINKKAQWTVGKGYKSSVKTKKILDKIRGCGIDTFNSVMQNLIRTYTICGDSFAEIIKNKRGEIINLKPLCPENIKIYANDRGIITKYVQNFTMKASDASSISKTITFQPKEIFHLAWNRLGDAIHGISTVSKLQDIVKARQEAMKDMRTVFHRYVKPLWVLSVDSDDTTEIAAFKVKLDKTLEKSENLIVPKGTVDSIERVSIPQYSTLDPLPWIQMLNQYFLVAEGVPEVILGYGRDTTEASSKILYIAFQQMVEYNQNFLEDQIKAQLNLDIEFEFPADLVGDVNLDQKKDGSIVGEKKSEVSA